MSSRGGGGVRTPCTLSLDPPLKTLIQMFKVTRPSFFGGVPFYFEALWYPHLYFSLSATRSAH